jgi:hypothetical protein
MFLPIMLNYLNESNCLVVDDITDRSASSRYPQNIGVDENPGFQIVIMDVVSVIIMI